MSSQSVGPYTVNYPNLSTQSQSTTSASSSQKRMVVYYSDWSMYDPDFKRFASDIPTDCVTDVNYAFMNVDNSGNITLFDEWSDIQVGTDWNNPNKYPYWGNLQMLHQVKLAAQAQGKDFSTYFSVGGWGRDAPLAALASNASTRANFIQSAITMCQTYNLDGIDIDWEYPIGGNNPQNFVLLLQELHAAFAPLGLKITIATAAGPDNYTPLDWQTISENVDGINLMLYDFHGPWPGYNLTNHQAPVLQTASGDPTFNSTAALQGYQKLNADMTKVRYGAPLYFRTYAGVTGGTADSHTYSPYTGPGNPNSPSPGMVLWRQVMDDVANETNGAKGFWDPEAQAYSVYYSGTQEFATGMDIQHSIPAMVTAAKAFNCAGMMIWEFKGDDADCTATRSMYTQLNPAHPKMSQRPNLQPKVDFRIPDPFDSIFTKIYLFVIKLLHGDVAVTKKKKEIVTEHHKKLQADYQKQKQKYESSCLKQASLPYQRTAPAPTYYQHPQMQVYPMTYPQSYQQPSAPYESFDTSSQSLYQRNSSLPFLRHNLQN